MTLGSDESPRLKCKDRELQGILNRAPLTPPIALPTHFLCQWALPSPTLLADMMGWEEIVNSEELVVPMCTHTLLYFPILLYGPDMPEKRCGQQGVPVTCYDDDGKEV